LVIKLKVNIHFNRDRLVSTSL